MRRLIAALPLVLAAAGAGLAQGTQPPAQFISVTTVTARPEAVAEYEDYAKKIAAGAAKVGAPGPVLAYQVVSGGSPYTYVFSQPFEKWADVDAFMTPPQIVTKAHGDVEGARMVKAGRASIADVRTEVFRLLPDLSTRPARMSPPSPFLLVIRSEIRPEKVPDWEQFLASLKSAQEQAGSAMAIRRVSVQGTANTYATSVPFSKWADRDAWPILRDVLRKAYGEDAARRINEQRLSSVQHSQTLILRYRPDLSRLPAPAAR